MSRNKAKGTAAESAVRDFLQESGWPSIERLALSGGRDRGDLTGMPGWVHEVKNHKSYSFSEWLKETEEERVNAGAKYGALWVKRHGKGQPRDWFVVLDGQTFVRLLKEAGY